MSTTVAGVLFVLSLAVALAVAYRPLGDIAPCRHWYEALTRRARCVPPRRGEPNGRADLGCLRSQRPRLLCGVDLVLVRIPAPAGQVLFVLGISRGPVFHGLEHRGELHDQPPASRSP
jgi:hypothetical protein